jgi:hypothetical protein
MTAVAIFQALICVGVGIGKFFIDVNVRNILHTKLHGVGTCECLGSWLAVSLHYFNGLNAVMD